MDFDQQKLIWYGVCFLPEKFRVYNFDNNFDYWK